MKRFSGIFSAVLLALISCPLFAQSTDFEKPAARVTEAVDNSKLAALKNQVHPLVRKAADQGPVEDALQLDRLTLVLKRSDTQQQALTKLLADQQNPSSPNYHRWLTPKEFGERFGPAQADIQQVTAWLESQGFTVDRVANGRGFIEFSGNAGQVARAFHTSIHHYSVNGEAHIANSTTLAIPAALAPVAESVRSLNDFRRRPLHTSVAARVTGTKGDASSRPAITFDQANQSHGLAPSDYAAIYNIQTLYNQGLNGTGKTIAVVGRSNINPATLANFRSIFGLGTGSNSTVLNGPDPGVLDQIGVPCTTQADCPERDEALLDNEWSSAIAPGAAVKFVISKSTNTSDGIDMSAQYIIDNNIADVMTESFGACEASAQQSDANAVSALAQQAAAEGITFLVSTGDNGSAGCADPTSASATGSNATPSVNILASSPYTLAIGGTEFNEGCTIGADGQTLTCSNNSQYWSASNAASNSSTPFLSALGYIPENVWNESCPTTTTGSVTGCGPPNSSTGGGANLFAGSGGASQFFSKPSWQQLPIAGIPSADHRYLPDVSLTAAGHDFYVVCLKDSDCVPNSTGSFSLSGIAGTSASAPAFAGIMALVNQKVGARQGDAHTTLYTLAAREIYAQCNGSNQSGSVASNCIFNDTTVGNNAVPGQTLYGTTAASYPAGVGYDEATGLGSVNVVNLVNNWASAAGSTPTTTGLTVTPSTSAQNTSVNLSATVTGTGGTPTGNVKFTTSNSVTLGTVTLNAGIATMTTTTLPVDTYTVTAEYLADGAFAASTSNPVSVTVNPLTPINTTTTLTVAQNSSALGATVVLTAAVTGNGGTPTGNVTFVNSNNVTLGSGVLAAGVATLTTTTLPAGTYTVMANYAGDTAFKASTSNAVSVTIGSVAAISTTTVLKANSSTLSSNGSSNVTFTATVTPASNGSAVPTGSVTFFDGTVSFATVQVAASSGGSFTVTATTATNKLPAAHKPTTQTIGWLGGGGLATLACFTLLLPTRRRRWPMAVLFFLIGSTMFAIGGCGGGGSNATVSTPGAHTITAKYSGDANYAASTSGLVTVTVQ